MYICIYVYVYQTLYKVEKEPGIIGASIFSASMSSNPPSMVHFADGVIKERVPLIKGAEGFLVATFADGTSKTTELPNVCLDTYIENAGTAQAKAKPQGKAKAKAKAKGKAKAKAKGKAKGKGKGKGKREDGTSLLYSVMWYKNHKCIGIRAKTGQKNQVTSFGGKSVQKGKDEMKEIGHKAIQMIEGGSSVAEAKLEAERLMNL